jgi:hypothetical protein
MNRRRVFLKNVAIAMAGTILAPSILAGQVVDNKAIPGVDTKGLGHILDLRTGLKRNFVSFKGIVYNKSDLSSRPQAGVTIVILNQPSGLFKTNCMSKIKTNEKGEYHFLLDYPEREKGKMPRLKFDITNGENAYSSEVLLNDFSANISGSHWELNKQLGDKLFPSREKINNGVEVSLNLSV